MKVKTFPKRKKLTLNKKTIAHLKDAELKIVNGGYKLTATRCWSYCIC
jgi:natural product precursor